MKRKLSETVSEKAALPEELLSDVAVTQIRGTRSVTIEHHKGVQVYETEHIQIAAKRGAIHIYGLDLTIARMTKKAVEICGRIRRVELE